jgi:hypothetical protein
MDQSRRIRQHGNGASQECYSQTVQLDPGHSASSGSEQDPSHDAILRGIPKKTDSAPEP